MTLSENYVHARFRASMANFRGGLSLYPKIVPASVSGASTANFRIGSKHTIPP